MNKLVGVLGGLGPLATVYFMQTVIDLTDANNDQDNVDMIVTQHSSIPDRTAAIISNGESPVPAMVSDAKKLQEAGADFVVVPCNTATIFLNAVVDAVDIEVVNIVTETVSAISKRNPSGINNVAIMATEGTIASGIYQSALESANYSAMIPQRHTQKAITEMIYDYVKSGLKVPAELFYNQVRTLRDCGADAVICGCTELSVVYKDLAVTDPRIIDSLETLARLTILKSGKTLIK
ncbi:MAG: amino acid racemase [Varibaculum sp.]|nr:amino acid racemase [Varibaculum sp.]